MLKYKDVGKFSGANHSLFNFHKCNVEYDGVTLESIEHVYQSQKGKYVNQPDIAKKIKKATDGKTVKEIARKELPTGKKWHQETFSIMYNITLAKLQSNPHIKQELVNTKGKYLVEDTPIQDWGRGPLWNRRNEMGKLLISICDGPLSEDKTKPSTP